MSNRITVHLSAPRDGIWEHGETAIFTYGLDNDPHSEIAARLFHRSGSAVTILGRTDDVSDDPELSTLAQRADAGALRVYGIRFEDGHEAVAFEDELSEI